MEQIKSLLSAESYNILLNENISDLRSLIKNAHILAELTNAPAAVIDRILHIASQEILKNKYCLAKEFKQFDRIIVGCENIDSILSGGLPINGISEIFGCSGVGKTQFCLQLALNIQLAGKSKETIYICTEDVFPSKRLCQLSDAYRKKFNIKTNFEDRVYIRHIATSGQLQKCLSQHLPYFLQTKNVGLIIIDSIAGIFRSENENSNYVSRSREISSICNALNMLQDRYQCGILAVNQVTDNLDTGISEPCLGLSWANNVTYRFCIIRNNASVIRTFQVIFGPDIPNKSTNFVITPRGLENA